MPSTRPRITFNRKGVCSACTNFEEGKKINWKLREKQKGNGWIGWLDSTRSQLGTCAYYAGRVSRLCQHIARSRANTNVSLQ